MDNNDVNHFFKFQKYIMLLTGEWDFRHQKNNFTYVYDKVKYLVLIGFSMTPPVFLMSVFFTKNCKDIAAENFFNFMHCGVVSMIAILLHSKATKKIKDEIYNFENFVLENESDQVKEIYMRAARENMFVGILYTVLALPASILWFVNGRT